MHSRSPSRTNPRAPRGALDFTPTTTSVKVAPTLRRRRSAALLRPRGCMRLVVRFGVGHGSWSCTDRARRRDRHFGPLRGGVQKFCPHFWTFEESRGGTRPACYRRANRTSDAQGAASRVPAHPRSRTRRAEPFHVTWFTLGGCQYPFWYCGLTVSPLFGLATLARLECPNRIVSYRGSR